MEVFKKCYKKKDSQWSSPRALKVAKLFVRMMEECQRQQNSDQDLPLSSQSLVAPNEQQVWLSAKCGRKRGRVFGLGSEAHHTIVGPSHTSSSTNPLLSQPQSSCPDLDDQYRGLRNGCGRWIAPGPILQLISRYPTVAMTNTRPKRLLI
ncbi:UNVERIFIED_CONTAM: hypothetical protein Sindi_1728000 [Sesamum indicum]